ncbi:sigma-54-dependent Fis family transcriptional regulator [Hyalangium minutum]|uniref:Response regulator of zinc sigma-54-dependent two-component system n=1 Tax=Hyalangium minutum TaxID=394096 RepID=A0A085W6I2_9BACT|nr:sigma-54-dependent Fis family transcriptional regulator [Hyalangium minutum]KFE63295.1 Response regulator of zinc sigma-54-dependent two-component system [Hyalangium minutum]
MPELVFFRRGEEVLRFAIDRQRVVLGRGERSDVVIPDPDVSRQHVALIYNGKTCQFEDLSGNGTLVAGKSMKQGELQDGADIALGRWRAMYRERGTGETAGPTGVGLSTDISPVNTEARDSQPAQLRVKQGDTEFLHDLTDNTSFTLGKDPSNTIVVQDRFISSRHLKLTRNQGFFHVVDLNSTNGSFLGNVRIFDVEVPLNTVLRVGETELILEPASKNKQGASSHGIIGNDPAVRSLVELIERVAPSTISVTILGESGTGKELVAKALHTCSERADKAFIPVNCAAISKELIESELFGHEKGAFTGAQGTRRGAFEEAHGGTLFLDEIGELPMNLQAKLLRALESGEIKRVGASRPTHVDVRVVAATNRDLLSLAREGRFREDLYYRLCVMPVLLPPLRNRAGDLAALADHFVRMYSPRGQTVKLTPGGLEKLQKHPWPGNIRELRNVVHRALLLRKGPQIDIGDISFDQELSRITAGAAGLVLTMPEGLTLEQMLQLAERQIIELTLRRYGHNRERVAKELGLARSTLFKRLKEWGIGKAEEDLE